MKLKKYSTWSNFVGFAGLGLIIGFGILVLFPTFLSSLEVAKPTQALSNLKRISTGNLIYTFDYDYRYPHATAMPSVRAQLDPYLKNVDLYKGISTYSSNPKMNFNLSGVQSTENYSLPLASSKEFILGDQAIIFYALVTDKKSSNYAATAYADSHVKNLKDSSKLIRDLSYQFDRANITLAPPDYLANQDPLR